MERLEHKMDSFFQTFHEFLRLSGAQQQQQQHLIQRGQVGNLDQPVVGARATTVASAMPMMQGLPLATEVGSTVEEWMLPFRFDDDGNAQQSSGDLPPAMSTMASHTHNNSNHDRFPGGMPVPIRIPKRHGQHQVERLHVQNDEVMRGGDSDVELDGYHQ